MGNRARNVRFAGPLCILSVAFFAMELAAASRVQLINLLPAAAAASTVRTDGAGNIYVAGTAPRNSAFVAKISADGSQLIYYVQHAPVANSAAVAGFAIGPDGSVYLGIASPPASLITRLDPQGSVFSDSPAAFLQGGTPSDLAVDASGNVYATGTTAGYPSSFEYGSTPGSLSGNAPNFVLKLDSTLAEVAYSIGGYGGSHIAVDSHGNVYTAGATPNSLPVSLQNGPSPTGGAFQTYPPGLGYCNYIFSPGGESPGSCPDQYVTAIDSSGASLLYLTYLSGGSGGEVPAGIAVDAAGDVYVAGTTGSTGYPVTPAALETQFQANAPNYGYPPFVATDAPGFPENASRYSWPPVMGYVSELNPTGSALVFSTLFGGSVTDTITSMVVDQQNGLIYLAGAANSPDLPGLSGAGISCVPNSYVARLTMDGSAAARTEIASPAVSLASLAVEANGTAYLAGKGVLAQVDPDAPATPIVCVSNSSDLVPTASVAPGQLLTIFGSGLADYTLVGSPWNGVYPTSLQGASVAMNGTPVPILYSSPNQINVQVPFDIGDNSATVQVYDSNQNPARILDSVTLPVVASAPSVFQAQVTSADCPGAPPGEMATLVLNQDGSVNSCANPAAQGSTITIFVDGLGLTSPPQTTGTVVSSSASPGLLVTFQPDPNLQTLPVAVSPLEPFTGSISGVYEVRLSVENSGPFTMQINGMTVQGTVAVQLHY
jgi:uncharacterized protein (TIGR03437 family)